MAVTCLNESAGEEKNYELEENIKEYKQIIENLRAEKTIFNFDNILTEKQIFSQISEETKDLDNDSVSDVDYKPLNFVNLHLLDLDIPTLNNCKLQNLKQELEEVNYKNEKSLLSSESLILQNVILNISYKLKENVADLTEVNSQTADILQLENKEEKEVSKEIVEIRAEDDLLDESIQEQINAELKALRIQIAKSQAVLAFLQSKGSSVSQEVIEHSNSEKCFKNSEASKSQDNIIEDDRHQDIRNTYYEHSQSFKLEQKSNQIKHPPNRSNSSSTNPKPMPLHRAHFAFSCPILPSHTSFITRATQTDPIDSTFSSFRTSNGEHLFENLRSNSYCKTLNRTNALNTDNKTVGNSIPDYKVACAAQSLKTCLLAVPNAFCFQERVDSPISPSFPRNRSFSFVTAIKKGNPHLIDATDSYYCTNVEEKFSQSATDSLTKDNVHSEVPNISYCNSYSNIGKEYSPQIKPCPNEDKEYNRPFINMKNNINSSSQPLQTVLPNVELSKEISKNDKKKNEQTEKCELQLTIGGDSVEDKTSRAKNKKDNNIAEKDRISRNVKRRFSGSGQSHNSSPGIVRCPAFDFSEQEDEISIISISNVPNSKKRELVNKGKMQMPDLKENSETESAKGSANGSFELESGETLINQEIIYPYTGNDSSFPSLPESFLKRIGAHKDSNSIDSLSEHEIEAKFNSLSLAFKTDKFTLSKRLELHQRQRDIAEKNVETELNALKTLLSELGHHCYEGESKELISKMQNHIDIIEQSTSRISCRSEIFGAVQQEERISQAVEIMINHVENLKRLYKKEHLELEEMRNLWNEQGFNNDDSGGETCSGDESKRSLRSIMMSSTAKQKSTLFMENSMARNSSFWSSSSARIECQDSQNTTISNKLSLSYKWSELNYPKSGTINSSLHSVTIEHLNTDSLFSSSENCNCFRRKELNLKILRKRRMKNANIFAMNANPFIKSGANETTKNINNRKIKEIPERRNGLEEATNDSTSSIFGGRRRRLAKRLFCTGAWAASTIVALWLLAIKFLDENYPWDVSADLWLPELWEKAWSKVVWRRPGKPPI